MSRIKLNIEEDLLDFWYPLMSENINQVIAPFRQGLTKVEVIFCLKPSNDQPYSSQSFLYKCKITCKHREKETIENISINRDGSQAVTDSMSRLKRELVRAKYIE